MRVVGGVWRSRRLRVASGVRPTPDTVRETVFNVLRGRIGGARVLDVYAGTGSLGIEALSRGAASAVFIEKSSAAARALRASLQELGALGRARVEHRDARRWLARMRGGGGRYDLVFIDPPHVCQREKGFWYRVLASLRDIAGPGSALYREMPQSLAGASAGWDRVKKGGCGGSVWEILTPVPDHQ